MSWVVAALILAGAAAFPFIRERRKPAVSTEERRASGYQFADLSKGLTAYRWHGPTRGPVIVAVHGLTTPSQVWDDLVPRLTELGYRVATYDLYGRGLSDAPVGRQNAAFFQRQLLDLLDYLELKEDVVLMGYSMGGAIVTGFAATHKHRVEGVIMIAGAGVRLNETTFEKASRLLPGIGQWMSAMFLERRLSKDIDLGAGAHPIEHIRAAQLNRAGYIMAVDSSRRYQLSDQQKSEHRVLGSERVRLLAIWAELDDIIPISALGVLAQWNRHAQQDVIEGAGHNILETHNDEVAEAVRHLLTD